MHRDGGDQAINATIRRQYEATDEYLQDERHLVDRRVLDYEENVVAQVRQRYLSGVVLFHDSLRYQR